MGDSPHFRRLLAGLMTAGLLCTFAAKAAASEEARRFLAGLRERGYFDTALDFLEMARNDPKVDKQFKDSLDYEAGLTMIDDSRMGRVTSVREKRLSEARERFKKFLAEHPSHPLAAGAQSQLANLLIERGRIKAEQAEKPSKTAEEKAALNAEARGLYDEAAKVFADLEQRFLKAHQKFPKIIDPKDTEKIEARDQVRRDLLQARLALATVLYEIAHTHKPGSEGSTKNLEAAAKRYQELYEKYGARLAGLYARMWEGRCYKELGKTDEAFAAFEELLAQPDEPQPFRTLKNKAAVLALQTALLPKVKKYKESVAMYKEWERTARGDEDTPEGMAIKFFSGKAALELAKSLTKKEDAKQRKDLLTLSKQLFKDVSRQEGEHQKDAKMMLLEKLLGGADAKVEPSNFAEARDRAQEELGRMQMPDLKPEEVAKARTEAIKYFRMAMRMKTSDVTIDELCVIRYYLAYLYWLSDDLYDAAVAGEFLARRYSDRIGARQGAKIAMASYVKLFNEVPPGESRDFENRRMIAIAKLITERWKGEPEADEAWMMLIRNAVVCGDPKTALEYLGNVPADSPRRGEAELMTGQSLWSGYLKASRLPDAEKPPQAELDAMVEKAQQTLEAGINRMRKPLEQGGEITYTLVASVLSLAQIYIGAGQADQAVAWLDDPKIGAMTLVAANDPATDRGNFRTETYKAALRAYVAVQQLDKAEAAMNALEKSLGAGGGAKLTKIYISLGRQLEELLTRLRAEGKNDEAAKVCDGFEMFLTRISQRKEGNTFSSLNWVAETFQSLGAAMDPGGKTLPAEAQQYYTKAAACYGKILERCAADKQFAPAGADTSIKIRLAKCLRRQGKYKEALDLLEEILKVRNMMIDAQVEATYTYQSWGKEKPIAYLAAIKGGRKHTRSDGTPYYVVWGWGKIAKMVMRSPKHQNVFHEARFNLADCRFRLAQSQTGAERKATMKQAENDILIVKRLYPTMGGEEWYKKYDELLKKIQKLRGVPVTGLKETPKKKPKEKPAA